MNNKKSVSGSSKNTHDSWQFYKKTILISAFGASSIACMPQLDGTDGTDPKPDGTFADAVCEADQGPPALPEGHSYGYWKQVTLSDVAPGTDLVCANGEPYKFFVQLHEGASDLVVTLEGGGACWDYATCTDNAGVLKANRKGPPAADAMTNLDLPLVAMHPQFGRIDNGVPTNKYNQVFLPYCTADVFSGDTSKTYEDPEDPGQNVTIHHRGRRVMKGVAAYLAQHFSGGKTGQLLTMGTSAGGVGTMLNYALVREAVDPKCGAGINDAGPLFLPGSEQQGIVDLVLATWGDAILSELDQELDTLSHQEIRDNVGNVSHGLARTYPNDRFLLSSFREDLNFSVFSFAGGGAVKLGEPNFTDKILQKWDNELNRFKVWADNQPEQNWGYYFPAFRKDNCSHGVALTPFSMAHDSAYRNDGIAGKAHSYHRTELGNTQGFADLVWNENDEAVVQTVERRRHFGDAVRQLLDKGGAVPRHVGVLQPGQLSFTNPTGTAAETWYKDGRSAIISDPQQWVLDQKDPTVCNNPQDPTDCACSYIGDYEPPN